ncbi:MAG: hypothetical protein ACE5DK_00925, partial [Paracoccaceae bacterium]
TVQAGRKQRLFILGNDVNASQVTADSINLMEQPKCGTVIRKGGSFSYENSASCSGNQKFSYCLNTGSACDLATVTLRLVEVRDPIDTIASGPTTDLSGFSTQLEMNGSDLEITNVHLGRAASAETAPPSAVVESRLVAVAAEAPPIVMLASPTLRDAVVHGAFSIAEPEVFAHPDFGLDRVAEVSSDIKPQPNRAPHLPTIGVRLPTEPLGSTLDLHFGKQVALADRMVDTDTGFQSPSVMPGIDASPFGTPCTSELAARPLPGGLVRLSLRASCLPNSRVLLRHGKLGVAYKTGHSGTLDIIIPALQTRAFFSATLASGEVLKTGVQVTGLDRVDRIAVEWRDGYALGLTALEFGNREAPERRLVVLAGKKKTDLAARPNPGGYFVHLGDPDVENPVQAVVYSFHHRTDAHKAGVVELSIAVRATRETCGTSQSVRSYRSRDGRLIGASGLRFRLPDCSSASPNIVLKNAVRDLIIATR